MNPEQPGEGVPADSSSPVDATATEALDILLVEDTDADARFIEELVADVTADDGDPTGPDDVTVIRESTLPDGLERLEETDVDVVLLDLGLPESQGLETLRRALERIESVPVVVLTGLPERELGVDAVSEGAQDYLVKDELGPKTLIRTVRYAIERKAVRRELQRRNEELSILTRLLRHDIRNDASLVVGRGRELEAHVEPRGEALLEELVVAANHIVELTRTVGDIVEGVTRQSGMAVQPVDLAAILQSEVAEVRKLYGEDAVAVDGEIPPVEVRANELLGSVFANLLNNGIVYSGVDSGSVTVGVELDDERAVVRIADRGPGVPDEMKDAVFEEAVTDEESGGLGIGLYIVDRLVDQFDGDVWIEDNDPTGSVFHVALQRAEE